MSVTVIVHHISAALPLVWQRYHFGTIFRTPWGSKHCFHGNIGETHIDKRIGAAVFSPMTNETSKAEGVFSRWTQLNASNMRRRWIRADRRGWGRDLLDFSPWKITNSRSQYAFLNFFVANGAGASFSDAPPASQPACLPARQPACQRVSTLHPSAAANGQQFPIRFYFTNGHIDLVQLF